MQDPRTGQAAYAPLAPLLTATHGATSSPAASWTLIDVLASCFRPDPRERPTAEGLLRHPFFTFDVEDEQEALRAAEAYVTAPPPVPRWVNEHIMLPLERLLAVLDADSLGVPQIGTGSAPGPSEAETRPTFDVGLVSDVLRVVGGLVREESLLARAADYDLPGAEMGWFGRHRPALLDEAMRRGCLEALASISARLFAQEELQGGHDASKQQSRGVSVVGFLEGDRSQSAAARLAVRLEGLAQALILALQKSTAALASHVGTVLRFIVMCYSGRADPPPLCFAGITDPAADEATALLVKGGVDCQRHEGGERAGGWRPSLAKLFKPVLLEAVTEEGGGNWLYPPIRAYLHWCQLVADDVVDVEFDPVDRAFRCEAGSFAPDAPARGAPAGSGGAVVGVPFVRTAVYYRALVSVGSQLDALAAPDKGSRFLAKARVAACSFFAHMCRLDRDHEGGDPYAGARGRLGAAGEQRARLLLDLSLAKLLRPQLADPAHNVRAAALLCARNAIVTGLGAGDERGGDGVPRSGGGSALASSFCGLAWTSQLARVLRAGEVAQGGFAFEDKELAVDALGAMAAAAGRATSAWTTAEVPAALAAALSAESIRARPTRQDTRLHQAQLRPLGRVPAPAHSADDPGAEKEGDRGQRTRLDVRGVLEKLRVSDLVLLRATAAASGALKKLLTEGALGDPLASPLVALESGGRALLDLSRVPRTLAAFLRPPALGDDPAEDKALFAPVALRRVAVDLWKVFGWMSRLTAAIRAALVSNDASVLGDSVSGPSTSGPRSPPELLLEAAAMAWGGPSLPGTFSPPRAPWRCTLSATRSPPWPPRGSNSWPSWSPRPRMPPSAS